MDSTYLYGAHVRANGIRQHYLRYGGKGTPVVIVPGITSPAVTWGFVADRIGRACDTYVLDVRGRGLSEAGPDLDYGLDACAADVASFADAMGLTNYVLLGHSMGGRICIRAARRHALKAGHLVLVDPPVSGPGRRAYPSQLSWYLDSIRLMRQGGSADDLRPFVPTWSDAQVRLRAEWLHTCDERAIIAGFHGFHDDDIHQDMPHIGVPTLLVAAGRGGVILDEDLAEIEHLVPSIAAVRIEGAGHMIPWDDLEGFLRALRDVLGHAV